MCSHTLDFCTFVDFGENTLCVLWSFSPVALAAGLYARCILQSKFAYNMFGGNNARRL